MTSARVSAASAVLLMLLGIALLFAADDLLPALIPGFPVGAAWLGQLLGAAWLALAALNWLNRGARLGGIYGRPVVLANTILYFVGAMVLLKIVARSSASPVIVAVTVAFVIFAALYGSLLFRGPFRSDLSQ